MTEIKQLRCPNCSGLVTAPPGVTRVTCTYCGADLAVDLDKEEAMLYALDQQERSREKDRLAGELKPLYEQYMAVYNQLSVVDIELQQRELLKQNYTIRHQVKGLTQRHDDLVRSLSLISSQIAKIDEVVHPGIVTQLPVP